MYRFVSIVCLLSLSVSGNALAEIVKCVDAQGVVIYSNVKQACPKGTKLDIPENYPKATPYIPKYDNIYSQPQQSNTQNGIPFTIPKAGTGAVAPAGLPPLPGTFLPLPQQIPAPVKPSPAPETKSQPVPLNIPEGQGGVFLKPPVETDASKS